MKINPAMISEMQGNGDIGDISMTAIARQLFLPTASNTKLSSSAILVVFTVLTLLSIIIILRLSQRSEKPIDRLGQSVTSVPREEEKQKKPATVAEEELSLEGKSPRLSHPQDPEPIAPTPAAVINENKTLRESLEAPPPYSTAMANKKESPSSTPSVLRPTARPPTPHSGPSATIALPQGRYTGVLLPASSTLPRAVEAWRGIPYAQPTGGANRFQPPVPLPPNAGGREVNAAAFGAICPGSVARVSGIREGEDCLNLNVYRQRGGGHGGEKMPVLVYVHGGAFNGGMGVERDMASFVGWAGTPIVGINFNYRVGALGFPSSVVADAEGCLNLGLRDQRLLFEWVRENVGAFGGDPNRVTVMGLSAGAHSVSLISVLLACCDRGTRLSYLCLTGEAELDCHHEAGSRRLSWLPRQRRSPYTILVSILTSNPLLTDWLPPPIPFLSH